jgi:hypothetical protein
MTTNAWQRPPFEPGNMLAMKSGVYSPRVVDPIAAELVAGIHADPSVPFLRETPYQAAVWAWARAEARVIALTRWLELKGNESGIEEDGKVTPTLTALAVWEKIAANHRTRLGLDPLSRAKLGKDLAGAKQADAVAMLTQMREDYERQQHSQDATQQGQDVTQQDQGAIQ